jgi:hypothetical protein
LVWDINSSQPSNTLQIAYDSKKSNAVYSLAVLPDGRLVSGSGSEKSGNNKIQVWDVVNGQCLKVLRGCSTYCLTVLSDDKLVSSGAGGKNIRVWDINSGQCVKTFVVTGKNHLYTYCLSLPGGMLVSSQHDKIQVWDVDSGQCVKTLDAHLKVGQIWCLTILPDGRLVSGNSDGTIKIWSHDEFQLEQVPIPSSPKSIPLKAPEAPVKTLSQQGQSPSFWSPIPTHQNPQSEVEQVKVKSQSVIHQVNPADAQTLAKWVTDGHLVEVEKLLQKDKNLAHVIITIKDRSDRVFECTGFQYAAWALDIEMCEVFRKYLDNENASLQIKALEKVPKKYSQHGAHYNMTDLIEKTQTYINNYTKWDTNQCCQYWQKEVGGEQRKCPAWRDKRVSQSIG